MLKLTSSPYAHSGTLTSRIMLWVMGAMLPAMGAELYYFGYGVAIQASLALALAWGLEMMVAKWRRKPVFFYAKDFSGSLTALILAMAIPPYAPYWLILIGVGMAILLGKQVYGGLGQNVFNPAMVGFAVLLISFPVAMTTWLPPLELLGAPLGFRESVALIFTAQTSQGASLVQLLQAVDGLAQATPLNTFRTAWTHGAVENWNISPIFGPWGLGIGWAAMNLCFLAGGVFLLCKRLIQWQIPAALLFSFTLCCTVHWLVVPFSPSPSWALLSGATMFGAFFVATDPVTAPITPRGKLIFGALIGVLLYVIRYHGGYPDAIAFAVLLANMGVPLIDRYIRPIRRVKEGR